MEAADGTIVTIDAETGEVYFEAKAPAVIRKPNPEMIWLATRRLGVKPADAWYVGDNFDRDVLCGVRAGIGGNILMEAKDTYEMPYDLPVTPDAVVANPHDLLQLFRTALAGVTA